jgi:branched-chain amino acid transport system permease protein
VNFAHGSLYMLGAYLAYSLVTTLPRGHLGFWGGVIAAAVLVGLIGLVVEVLLLRRIYRAPELFQLLATFGVVLIVQDVAQMIWGPQDLLGPRAPGLRGSIEIVGMRFPLYELFLIASGRWCWGCSCCCSIARAGALWCGRQPRIARWWGRSA